MVGPRLFVTNHHVLGNADEASQAEAQFGYEHDLDGVLLDPVEFDLQPHELFYTDAARNALHGSAEDNRFHTDARCGNRSCMSVSDLA